MLLAKKVEDIRGQ